LASPLLCNANFIVIYNKSQFYIFFFLYTADSPTPMRIWVYGSAKAQLFLYKIAIYAAYKTIFHRLRYTRGKTMRQPLLPKRQWMKIYVGCVTVNAVCVINQFSLHTPPRFCNSVQFWGGGHVGGSGPCSYAILSIYAIERESFAFG